MKQLLFTGLIGISSLLSCKQPTEDGTYVTYKVSNKDERFIGLDYPDNDSISQFLNNKLKQKKYFITFNDKFATVRDLEMKQETILAKETRWDKQTYYKGTIEKGSQTLLLSLWSDSTDVSSKVLVADLIVKRGSIFIPTQVGMNTNKETGRAVCYLNKVEVK